MPLRPIRHLLRTLLTRRGDRPPRCPVCRTSVRYDDDVVLLHGRRAHVECAERQRLRFQ